MNIRQISNWSIIGLLAIVAYAIFIPAGPKSAPEFPSNRYPLALKTQIVQMAKKHDCKGLQKEFDFAHSADGYLRARTGAGSSKLMGYVDYWLGESGCYG